MELAEHRIRTISKKHHLSHVGSCISVVPILQEIYRKKSPSDKVLLDNAHAHLAHLLFTQPGQVEELLTKYGIHCDVRAGCDASGGSLGHALGIAIGLALTDKDRQIYVVVSDGSMMEGSNWEALRLITDLRIHNVHIYCNFNGYSAVAPVDITLLEKRMRAFAANIYFRKTKNGEGLEGLEGHYKLLE